MESFFYKTSFLNHDSQKHCKKCNEEERWWREELKKQGEKEKEQSYSFIALTKFERVARKA